MRSSNKRSRSKSNRPKTLGNIVNRVFDSSGPEGKVRGTPQQIIDKYTLLARDAQLSGDRVAAENFLQHAEHYTRMLSEAQREMAREADARRDQQPHNNGGQNRRADQRDDAETPNAGEASETDGGERRAEHQGNRRSGRRDDHRGPRDARGSNDDPREDQPRASREDNDSMLVETPESRREHFAGTRSEARAGAGAGSAETSEERPATGAARVSAAEAKADEAPKVRKPRSPSTRARKPKAGDDAPAGGAADPGDAPKAAE
ncbi:MAG: DUF4167 domain-containing protein [Pararhodobacter sp.]